MPGLVASPVAANYGDGIVQQNSALGKQGEQLSADIHGQYYAAAVRGKVFKANKTAITIPVIAATLASLFSLYNPPGSGVIAEVIHTEVGQVLATTVVDTLGWYSTTVALTALGTVGTQLVAGTGLFSARTGDTPSPQCSVGSFTHSGTPVRTELVASFGAVTDAVVFQAIQKAHNGTTLVTPGTVISLAMSTAAGTASGLDVGVTWAEWPYAAAA